MYPHVVAAPSLSFSVPSTGFCLCHFHPSLAVLGSPPMQPIQGSVGGPPTTVASRLTHFLHSWPLASVSWKGLQNLPSLPAAALSGVRNAPHHAPPAILEGASAAEAQWPAHGSSWVFLGTCSKYFPCKFLRAYPLLWALPLTLSTDVNSWVRIRLTEVLANLYFRNTWTGLKQYLALYQGIPSIL